DWRALRRMWSRSTRRCHGVTLLRSIEPSPFTGDRCWKAVSRSGCSRSGRCASRPTSARSNSSPPPPGSETNRVRLSGTSDDCLPRKQRGEGDSLVAVFARATDAVAAALALQQALLDLGIGILDFGLADRVKATGGSGLSAVAGNPKSNIQNPKLKVRIALHT